MPRSRASYRRGALKGWRTRRRRERRRRRSYKGVEIRAGYRGRENSFALSVIINTHKPIGQYSDDQLADLVEKLAQQGHFNDSRNNPVSDLAWVFFNDWHVVRRDVRIARGRARLTQFERSAP